MRILVPAVSSVLAMLAAAIAGADDVKLAPKPLLRIDAEGPLSHVTSLAFRQDAESQQTILHAAGLDKTIHAWGLAGGQAPWRYDRDQSLRVPIAPGVYGSLNAMAVSGDGEWLAAAGRGVMRGLSGWEEEGFYRPASDESPEMQLDVGTILVFEMRTRKVRRLQGHTGTVRALTFVNAKNAILVSGAFEKPVGSGGTLRVWDVKERRQLQAPLVLKDIRAGALQLGLTAWSTGPQPESIRVAAAWGDRKLRVWDVAANRLANAQFENGPAVTAWALPGPAVKLLAGADRKVGAWTVANLPDGKTPDVRFDNDSRQNLGFDGRWFPLAVTAVPKRGTDSSVLAAWVVLAKNPQSGAEDFWLALVDMKTGVVKKNLLWGIPAIRIDPVIAADPSGAHLAVAGNAEHEIWVFRVTDLLNGNTGKQVLKSTAQTVRYVSFAKRDDQRGLVLAETPGGTPTRKLHPESAKLFDFEQRRLTTLEGWNDFNAEESDWKIGEAKTDPKTNQTRIPVMRAGQLVKSITLEPGDRETTSAVLATTKLFKDRLLAVALQHENEPLIALYNLTTEKLLCFFNGHEAPITSLRFSWDEKYLASAALDNMVCLWWLADLPQLLQSRGEIRDLEVEINADGRLVVKSDRPGRFSPGAVLTVIEKDDEENARSKTFGTGLEFYAYIADRKPGTSIDVNIAGADGRQQVVPGVPIESATPERKPLCSLYVFQGEGPGEAGWIGWDPLGRYDASGPDAERRLGWLFNIREQEFPVKFAAVEDYREQNRRPGLIFDHLKLGPLLVPKAPPEPEMSLLLRAAKQPLDSIRGEKYVARSRDLSAVVQLGDFTERLIANVIWRVADTTGAFQPIAEGSWEANLAAIVPRKATLLRAEVETKERPPRVFSREAHLLLLPPRPEIEMTSDIPATAADKHLDFSMRVRPNDFLPQQSVAVTLVHEHAGRKVAEHEFEAEPEQEISRQITLQMGVNLLKLTARNANAVAETRSLEETRHSWSILLPEPRDPVIQLLGFVQPGELGPLPLVPGEPWKTDRPQLIFRGRMAVDPPDFFASASFFAAEVAGEAALPIKPEIKLPEIKLPETRLTGFEKKSAFEFNQSIVFAPGMQTVTFTGITNRELTAHAEFNVNFTPALPSIKQFLLTLDEKGIKPVDREGRLIEGRHTPRITAHVQLTPPPQNVLFPHDAELVLRVKPGTDAVDEKPIVVRVQDNIPTIRKTFNLSPGVNEISVVLRNRWGSEKSLLRSLEFRQPPKILLVTVPQEAMTSEVTLEADIESKTKPTRVAVLADGHEVSADKTKLSKAADAKDVWKVAAMVPLKTDGTPTNVDVSAWNEDGETLEPRRAVTKYVAPKPQIPEIRIDKKSQTATGHLRVDFRVRSKFPLDRVEARIMANGATLHPYTYIFPKVADAFVGPSEFMRFTHEWSLEEIGERQLEIVIEAENKEGASRTDPIPHNYLPEPLRISKVRLFLSSNHRELVNTRPGFKTQYFDDAPEGLLELKGTLDKIPAGKKLLVKIWVNGFMQSSPAVLTENQEATFSSTIALNVANANRIMFELPNSAAAEHGLPTLILNCSAHLPPPRLHLLTVVAGETELSLEPGAVALLHGRIVKALETRTQQAIPFNVIPYPIQPPKVLTGEFREPNFRGLLFDTQQAMHLADKPGQPCNDVLLVYYAGSLAADDGQFALRTGDPGSPISESSLGTLGNSRGAHLLLLDIENDPQARAPAAWKFAQHPRLGVLRVVASRPTPDLPHSDRFRLITALEKTFEQEAEKELSLKEINSHLKRELDVKGNPGIRFLDKIPADLQELVLKR